MSSRKTDIPMEKVVYLFIVVFNILAIIFLYDFNSFIEIMIWADIILIAIIKLEKVLVMYVMAKGTFTIKKKK